MSTPTYPPPPPPGPQYPPPSPPSAPAYPQYPQYAPPQGATPWQQPAYGTGMPSANWGWSIAGVLFFLFTGLVALYFSSQVKSMWTRGDVAGSTRASRNARTWGIVSIVVGVLVAIAVASQGGTTTG